MSLFDDKLVHDDYMNTRCKIWFYPRT